jgi:chromosomal replication initiator protein
VGTVFLSATNIEIGPLGVRRFIAAFFWKAVGRTEKGSNADISGDKSPHFKIGFPPIATSYSTAKFATMPDSKNWTIQDGTLMVDGVVDIPLPGMSLEPGEDGGDGLALRHFLAGPENRLVPVAVRSVLQESPESNDTPHDFSPLVLYGPSGAGKSHIALGLATAWKNRNRRDRIVTTTAIDFARELADAIESQAVEEFRTKYRTANLLVFEDLGQLTTRKSGKLSAQEEFIHTLDALLAADRWVIVTASASPAELPDLLPALQSRLSAGLSIPLAPPGAKARLAVLRQLAADKEIDLPESVAEILAEGLSGAVPELAGALIDLASPADDEAPPIRPAAARQFLNARNHKRQPTLHQIALATARHFSIRLADLRSPVRRRALVAARGVAFFLARHCAGASLQEIGRYFGGRDHSTVMHSCLRTEQLADSDPTIHQAVNTLRQQLWKT